MILASKSPRRRELLNLITPNFKIDSANVNERLEPGTSPDKAVEYLSKIKAEPFRKTGDVIIGADTVVALSGKILGKPKNEKDAFNMLRYLSGKKHSVYTGVTVICGEMTSTFYERTYVEFYELSDEMINEYIKTGEPFDKAGAYGIQGKGSLLVKGIEGDFFNVVGLPVSKLYRKLKELSLI